MRVEAPAKIGAPNDRAWQCKVLKKGGFNVEAGRRKWLAGAFDRLRSKGVAE